MSKTHLDPSAGREIVVSLLIEALPLHRRKGGHQPAHMDQVELLLPKFDSR